MAEIKLEDGKPVIEFYAGRHLGTRFCGANFRDQLETALSQYPKVICDFSGVETVGDSFADECFGKLLTNGKLVIAEDRNEVLFLRDALDFRSASPFIKGTIRKAILERARKKSEEELKGT